MKRQRFVFYSLAAAVLLGALAAEPALADGVGKIVSVITTIFGGPLNLTSATTGQVPAKQADGSWAPSTISTTHTLQQSYNDGATIATTGNTPVALSSTAADNASILTVVKNPAGAQSGSGFSVTMGATTTGTAIFANQTTGGSGSLLQLQNNATDRLAVSNQGASYFKGTGVAAGTNKVWVFLNDLYANTGLPTTTGGYIGIGRPNDGAMVFFASTTTQGGGGEGPDGVWQIQGGSAGTVNAGRLRMGADGGFSLAVGPSIANLFGSTRNVSDWFFSYDGISLCEKSGGVHAWTSSATDAAGTIDTGISRGGAAATIAFGNGTAANATGLLQFSGAQLGGGTPTARTLSWNTGGSFTATAPEILGPTDQDLFVSAASAGASSNGRNAWVTSGKGGSTSGNSGTLTLASGSVTSGASGGVTISTPSGVGSNNVAGPFTVTLGTSAGSGTGPNATITAGPSTSGTGGAFSGAGGSSGAAGGAASIAGGAGLTTGGAASVTGGLGATGGGAVSIAGGQGTGGSNLAPGGVSITTGLGTGNASAAITMQTAVILASGSSAQSACDRVLVTSKAFTGSTTTGTADLFLVASNAGSNTSIGLEIQYVIEVADGSNHCSSISGTMVVAASNRAGTVTATCTTAGTSNQAISDTTTFTSLASTTTATVSGTNVQCKVTPSWAAGTPTSVKITYQVRASGGTTLTPQ